MLFTSNSSIFAMQKEATGFFKKITQKIVSLFSNPNEGSIQNSLSLNNIQSLQQNDFWRCGYFAAFNAFNLFKAINGKAEEQLTEILANIGLQNRQEQFEKFFDNLQNSEFKELIQNKAWLNYNQIENLLNILFGKSKYTQHINISIIDELSWNFNSMPSENYIFQNIKNLREKNIPQIIICVLHGHWTAHVFTKKKIWTTNSIYNYEKNETTNFLKYLHHYFTSQNFDLIPKKKKGSSSSSSQIIDLTNEDKTKEYKVIDLTKEPEIISLTQPEIIDLT